MESLVCAAPPVADTVPAPSFVWMLNPCQKSFAGRVFREEPR